VAAMTSASDEKWRPFNCFFSRVGLRTYQHPCIKFHENPSIAVQLFHAHTGTDGRTDMTKLTAAFPNKANGPNN